MAKQGVWGDRYRIYYPIQYKRVTCSTCIHYCKEDMSCLAKGILPRIAGYDYWKHCSDFDLSPEYLDSKHMDQVRKVKGINFFNKHMTLNDQDSSGEKDSHDIGEPKKDKHQMVYIPSNVQNDPKDFYAQVIRSLWINNHIEVTKTKLIDPHTGKQHTFYLDIDKERKTLFRIISKIKKKDHPAKYWTLYKNHICKNLEMIKSIDLEGKYLKMMILPLEFDKKQNSYAETFVNQCEDLLEGIRILEMDQNGKILQVNSSAQEKYWTKEAINKLKIFKQPYSEGING